MDSIRDYKKSITKLNEDKSHVDNNSKNINNNELGNLNKGKNSDKERKGDLDNVIENDRIDLENKNSTSTNINSKKINSPKISNSKNFKSLKNTEDKLDGEYKYIMMLYNKQLLVLLYLIFSLIKK